MLAKTAPLTNMTLCHKALLIAIDREEGLPGLSTFTGPSGYGKSVAAAYAAQKEDAAYIECRSSWTRKFLAEKLSQELGLEAKGSTPTLVENISERLLYLQKPLIIDEADFILKDTFIEIIRDIYELSKCPILLIAEERFPAKLNQNPDWERVSNRVLSHIKAQPASVNDSQRLRELYSTKVEITDDLLEHIRQECRGVVRRIVVNLDMITRHALKNGLKVIDREVWGDRDLNIGQAPIRKVA